MHRCRSMRRPCRTCDTETGTLTTTARQPCPQPRQSRTTGADSLRTARERRVGACQMRRLAAKTMPVTVSTALGMDDMPSPRCPVSLCKEGTLCMRIQPQHPSAQLKRCLHSELCRLSYAHSPQVITRARRQARGGLASNIAQRHGHAWTLRRDRPLQILTEAAAHRQDDQVIIVYLF